jgi:hypothetical protein
MMHYLSSRLLAFVVGAAIIVPACISFALVAWLLLHFALWTPFSGVPWVSIRWGAVVGFILSLKFAVDEDTHK